MTFSILVMPDQSCRVRQRTEGGRGICLGGSGVGLPSSSSEPFVVGKCIEKTWRASVAQAWGGDVASGWVGIGALDTCAREDTFFPPSLSISTGLSLAYQLNSSRVISKFIFAQWCCMSELVAFGKNASSNEKV